MTDIATLFAGRGDIKGSIMQERRKRMMNDMIHSSGEFSRASRCFTRERD